MTTTSIGRQAEQAACEHLVRLGYEIVGRNWKTRFCEIDIIAQKTGYVYFVEVKFRATATHGSGLDYITGAKVRRMRFAADVWLAKHRWYGNTSLAAIEVCAPDFAIGGYIESIDLG